LRLALDAARGRRLEPEPLRRDVPAAALAHAVGAFAQPLEGTLDLYHVPGRGLWDRKSLGSIYEKNGELKLQVWVLCLFSIGTVLFEGAIMRQECSLVAWTKVRVVENGGRRGRGRADGLGSHRSSCGMIVIYIVLRSEKVIAVRGLVIVDVVRRLLGRILGLHQALSRLPWWPQVLSVVIFWNAVCIVERVR